MTRVKICGNRTPEDVLAAAEAGADLVGLIFAESKRQVSAAEARVATEALVRSGDVAAKARELMLATEPASRGAMP